MRVRDFLDPNHNWNLNPHPNPCTVSSDSKADTLRTNTTVCCREVSTFGRCLLRESCLCIETFERKIHDKFIWVQYFVIIMVQYWSNFGVNNLLYLATHVCSFVCLFVCFFSSIPTFIQAHQRWRRLHLGVCVGGGFRTSFGMSHLHQVPHSFGHLAGMLEIFKSKLVSYYHGPNNGENIHLHLQRQWKPWHAHHSPSPVTGSQWGTTIYWPTDWSR